MCGETNRMTKIALVLAVLFSFFLGFYRINNLPEGLNIDEVSQGYNAHSLLLTGKDRYGKVLPVLFKSFEAFQPPLYAYLTTIPISILGKGNVAVRFVSNISQALVVVMAYFVTKKIFPLKKGLAIITSLIIVISPWHIFFSRYATEASPALLFILLSIYFFLNASRKNNLILAFVFLALSTHAYYSERLIAPLVVLGFFIFWRDWVFNNMKKVVVGILIFTILVVPHLVMFQKGSFIRRFDQVTYVDKVSYNNFGIKYHDSFLGRLRYILREFSSQYVAYLSPANLFLFSDSQEGRSIPNVSVYYIWMVIPFLLGFFSLTKMKFTKEKKFIVWIFIASIVPASLSNDPFYTLRVFLYLWLIGIIISLGCYEFLERRKAKSIKAIVFVVILLLSLASFYQKYFVLFKHERAENFGYLDKNVAGYIKNNLDSKILVDLSERDLATGLRLAYYLDYPPKDFQETIGQKYLKNYYSENVAETTYKFENTEVRPIFWEEDVYKDQIIIGDTLAISEKQVLEHKFDFINEFVSPDSKRTIRVYKTNPYEKCGSVSNGYLDGKCID